MIRTALSHLARKSCEALVTWLPQPRVIRDRDEKDTYLSRWYLLNGPATAFATNGNPVEGETQATAFSVMLHKFHKSDDAGDLHNHPWKFALSFVLAGGYSEEKRTLTGTAHDPVTCRTVLPFTFNLIRATHFHRVDLLEKDAWTLFVSGPRINSWGFWNRSTQEYRHWREYLHGRKLAPIECVIFLDQ